MASWPDGSRFDDRTDIVVAEIVRPRAPWLFLLCVVLAFLFAAGLIAVWWTVNRHAVGQMSESRDEKQAEVSLAFGGTTVGVDSDEIARIERLFRQLVNSDAADVDALAVSTFDMRRYLDQVKAYTETRDSYIGRLLKEQTWEESFAFPHYWTDYRLCYVKLVGDDEARVYGYFWLGESLFHVRWWLKRSGDRWRFYDWELLDFGLSFAHKIAIFSSQDTFWTDGYYDLREAADEIYDLVEGEGYEAAAVRLTSADTALLPANLRDNAMLHLARAWATTGNTRRAMQCCRRARSPENAPGIFYLMASTYAEYGQASDALEAIQQYEHWCGMGPDSIELRADTLETLDRTPEAIQAWKQLLGRQPDHPRALRALAGLLADDEKEILPTYVELSKDAMATARSLAQSSAELEDRALVSILARWIETKAPGSADALFVDGLREELAGDPQVAAQRFLAALQQASSEELQGYCRYRYVIAMVRAGRAAQLLDSLPEPQRTLETLYFLHEDGYEDVSSDSLLPFISAYRQRFPDDPSGDYHAGLVLSLEDRNKDAVEAFEAALSKCGDEDQDLRKSIQAELMYALVADGQSLAAYETLPPVEETFLRLADHYVMVDKYAELEDLLLRHEATTTTKPWVDYYWAVVALNKRDYEKTQAQLARLSHTDDESLRFARRRCRINLAIDSLDVEPLLAEFERTDNSFAVITARLQNEQRWNLLDRFLERLAAGGGDAQELLPARVDLHAGRQEDQKVVDLLHPWPAGVNEITMAPHVVVNLRDTLLRSYLHLQRHSDAESLAQQIFENEGERFPMLLAAASRGDVARTMEIFAQLDPNGFSGRQHYRDPDLGKVLRSNAFRAVRDQHPPRLPFRVAESTFVLLNRDSVQPEVEQLRGCLGDDLTLLNVVPSTADHDPGTALVQQGDVYYLIVYGLDPYHDSAISRRGPPLDTDLLTRLDRHDGWIAVQAVRDEEPFVFLSGSRSNAAEIDKQVAWIASRLIRPETEAVYAFRNGGRLLAATEALPGMMGQADFLERLEEIGRQVSLSPRAVKSDQSDLEGEDRSVAFADASQAWSRKSANEEVQVEVLLRVGMASERHWLVLEEPRRTNYGAMMARVRFLHDSQLLPSVVAGELVIIDGYDVMRWKRQASSAPPAGP